MTQSALMIASGFILEWCQPEWKNNG